MKRLFSVVMLIALLLAAFVSPAGAQSEAQSYILMANSTKLPARLNAAVTAAGGTITRSLPQIGLAFATSSNPDFKTAAAAIPGISLVMPNVVVDWLPPVDNVALDADYGNPPASGDDDPLFDLQWGHDAIDAPEAWELGYRGAGVRVAVLDTGFDLDHPDLAPNINLALSMNFVPGETLEYTLPDPFSHGTHTAGTVAAADNAFGTIGVAPEAELVLVKVLGDEGSGTWEGVIAGIVYAADVDADIISMSLGATLQKSGWCDVYGCVTAREVAGLLTAINRATTYAYQQGSTVIAAAGNEAMDSDHTADVVHAPSSGPNVIAISATAPIGWGADPTVFLDNLASYSNYGQSSIDFAAPGGDYMYYFVDPGAMCTVAGITRPCYVFDYVFSTGNGTWYWSVGTSMATPHAAGVAAIIIGKNGGDMHPAQVEAAMRASADDLGKPGNDDAYGAGRVNAYHAVH
jgi:lantibiotic leader peptide-processing serine protease